MWRRAIREFAVLLMVPNVVSPFDGFWEHACPVFQDNEPAKRAVIHGAVMVCADRSFARLAAATMWPSCPLLVTCSFVPRR